VPDTFKYKDTVIKPHGFSHISIKDRETCRTCREKPCTFICPSGVYWWREDKRELEIRYRQCLECGASLMICPKDNIRWAYPAGGYGVEYRF